MDNQCWMSLHACHQGLVLDSNFGLLSKGDEEVNYESLIKIITRALLTHYYKIWVQFTGPYST
jgi:hypothetical protein